MTEPTDLLGAYLAGLNGARPHPGAAATYASLDQISGTAPNIAGSIIDEIVSQRTNLKLIASENYCSLATQLAQGNLLTDKYAEGVPHKRFYAGCENVDAIEADAAATACALFGADHAYLQPHSGADANLVAFLSVLQMKVEQPLLEGLGAKNPAKLPRYHWNAIRSQLGGQRLLAMDYYSGGHLTHGYRHNISSWLFDAHNYTVDRETGLVDLDALYETLKEVRPLLFLAGYSAYPRKLNFAKMRQMADDVGAVFMVDMAHFAGLVAGKVFTGDYDPVAHAHIVTTTTHKTLRGPRGGMILCQSELAEWVDKGCPAMLGGPLPHAIAAKAVALREASQPAFREYAAAIVDNARALAESLRSRDLKLSTGGTDNHMVLIDVAESLGLTGRQTESALRECGITLNRNALPFDHFGPWYTSGLRVGTPAVTTLGMGAAEMDAIAGLIDGVLRGMSAATFTVKRGPKAGQQKKSLAKYVLNDGVAEATRAGVQALLGEYVLYPEIDLALLQSARAELA